MARSNPFYDDSQDESSHELSARYAPSRVSNYSDTTALNHHQQALPFVEDTTYTSHKWSNLFTNSTRSRLQGWWWWWEISAIFFSVVCLFIIMGILVYADNRPLSHWHLSIQPNSLIAVFTTLGKGSIVVVAAECISQLKWRYFERPRRLDHLQIFEKASRGPWGATKFIWLTRGKDAIATLGAVVTVIALAIEPTTQQILSYQQRGSPITSSQPFIGRAETYQSKAFAPSKLPDTEGGSLTRADTFLLPMQGALMNAIMGSPLEANFACPSPANECTWPDFTSLGVCGTCEDITPSTKVSCIQIKTPAGQGLNCSFTPNTPSYTFNLTQQFLDPKSASDAPFFVGQASPPSRPNSANPLKDFVAVNKTRDIPSNNITNIKPFLNVTYCAWRWCAKSYKEVRGTRSGVTTGTIVDVPFTGGVVHDGPDDPTYELDFNVTKDFNGTAGSIRFSVDSDSVGNLEEFLSDLIQGVWQPYTANTPVTFVAFMRENLTLTVDNVATALTNQVRSTNPGDNVNATRVFGQATVNETFVVVRWAWLTVLILDVLLAIGLLTASVLTRTAQGHLLKTSVIGLLFHGLRGWQEDELAVRDRITLETLEQKAKGIHVRFAEDDNGVLRFEKVD